jgi:rubrerythrin
MQWTWTSHTQGPDEPVYIVELNGKLRFIARLDDELKTRADLMSNGFLLAAAPESFAQALRFSECLDLLLRGEFAPSRETLEKFAEDARAVIAYAKHGACRHNEMVANDDSVYAWRCADCGHVCGKD